MKMIPIAILSVLLIANVIKDSYRERAYKNVIHRKDELIQSKDSMITIYDSLARGLMNREKITYRIAYINGCNTADHYYYISGSEKYVKACYAKLSDDSLRYFTPPTP